MSVVVQAAGFTAALVSIVTFMPQALRVWRCRHDGQALGGVSPATLWCLVTTQICWAIYGLGTGAVWNVIPSLVVLPLAVFMLYIVGRAARRTKLHISSPETEQDQHGVA